MLTNCECTQSGFCSRHQCVKTQHWFTLCQTRKDYFEMWEEGRGPGQRRPQEPGLVQKTLNLGKAVMKHAANGLQNVGEDVYQSRLAHCRICSSLDVERMVCQEPNCGCYVEKKAWWASEACPLGKWLSDGVGEPVEPPQRETPGQDDVNYEALSHDAPSSRREIPATQMTSP